MPDCFISHSSSDSEFARQIKRILENSGLTVFLSTESIGDGEDWSNVTLENLRNSQWVLFLASEIACSSPYVQQEIGQSLYKNLIPIIWDITPEELPGWANRRQAIDIRNNTTEQIHQKILKIAEKIGKDKLKGQLIIGGILAALFWVFSGE